MENTQKQEKIKNYIDEDQSLKERMQQNDQKYKKICQLAQNENFDDIEKLQIFTKSSYDVELNVIFSYHAQKYQENLKDKIQRYIVITLKEELPKLKNQYSLAYVHHHFGDFLVFKSIVQDFPSHFFYKFKNIHVVQAGIIVKIFNLISFGSVNRLLDRLMVYNDTVREVQQNNKILMNQEQRSIIRNDGMNMNQKHKMDKGFQSGIHEGHIPEIKLIRNQIYGKPLQKYQLSQSGIPKVLQLLLNKFLKNQQFCKRQGIFRKNCDIEELQKLQQSLIKKQYDYLKQFTDAYVVAGCIKKVFHNLDTPLFSYQIYNLIMKTKPQGNQIGFLQQILGKMQNLNRRTFLIMVVFFMKAITCCQDFNKMTNYNISVVFGPCFFRPQKATLDDLLNSNKFPHLIGLYLNNFEEIIGHQFAVDLYRTLQKIGVK